MKTLTEHQKQIANNHGTEAPFSGPWLDEKRKGIYACVACGHKLFSSTAKYDSGSGWPSFWQALTPDVLGTNTDTELGVVRTEIHCSNCKSHMGHVFDDGPEPTGLRYCVNGSVLDFEPSN